MGMTRAELRRFGIETQIEKKWWGHVPRIRDDRMLEQACNEGLVVPVRNTAHCRVSENVPKRYRVLAPQAHMLLLRITKRWLEQNQITRELFIVVSSLTRPTSYQQKLIRQGMPVMDFCSHERGLAFDLSTLQLEIHAPASTHSLWEVLEHGKRTGVLNAVRKPHAHTFHVAVSPTFYTT